MFTGHLLHYLLLTTYYLLLTTYYLLLTTHYLLLGRERARHVHRAPIAALPAALHARVVRRAVVRRLGFEATRPNPYQPEHHLTSSISHSFGLRLEIVWFRLIGFESHPW